MKKTIKLLSLTVLLLLCTPMITKAENINCKNKITVHVFRGEGCGYCKKALAFFTSIQEEYKDCYTLKEHEVWYDDNNAALMKEVAEALGKDVSGVPFIVIGEQTFSGYATSMDKEIKNTIVSAANNDSFVDVVAKIQKGETYVKTKDKSEKESYDTYIIILIFTVVIGGFVALIYSSRKK